MVKLDIGTANTENMEELKAFSARFKQSTLDSFKQVCKEQSKQYTKVLEMLAEAYIESKGNLHLSIAQALKDQCTPEEIGDILGVQLGGISQNGQLTDRIEEIEQRANSTLMQVEGSKNMVDLRLASMEEMIAELSSNNERTRVEFMGSKSMTESDSNDVNIVPPKDWKELVGRFMNLEDSIRGEDSGLEIRVEVLESIAEEQGFSVRWEEENTVGEISTEETSFEDFEEVDMNEVI
jgi:hypothetical protein